MYQDIDIAGDAWNEFTSDTVVGFLLYSYTKWAKAIYHGFKAKGSFRTSQMAPTSVLKREYTGWK